MKIYKADLPEDLNEDAPAKEWLVIDSSGDIIFTKNSTGIKLNTPVGTKECPVKLINIHVVGRSGRLKGATRIWIFLSWAWELWKFTGKDTTEV